MVHMYSWKAFKIQTLALLSVYRMCGYFRLVQDVVNESMQEAVDEVCALPEYTTKGEVSEFYGGQHCVIF